MGSKTNLSYACGLCIPRWALWGVGVGVSREESGSLPYSPLGGGLPFPQPFLNEQVEPQVLSDLCPGLRPRGLPWASTAPPDLLRMSANPISSEAETTRQSGRSAPGFDVARAPARSESLRESAPTTASCLWSHRKYYLLGAGGACHPDKPRL